MHSIDVLAWLYISVCFFAWQAPVPIDVSEEYAFAMQKKWRGAAVKCNTGYR